MRAWGVLSLLLLSLSPPSASAAGWTSLLEDQEGDAGGRMEALPVGADPRADLWRVEARANAEVLYVRLVSGPHDPLWSDGATSFESLVELFVERDGEMTVVELSASEGAFLVDGSRSHPALAGATGWGHAWTMELRRGELFGDGIAPGERVRVGYAEIRASDGARGDTVDDATGSGTLDMPAPAEPAPGEAPPLRRWRATEGPEYAGGPSVAVAPDGRVHVAYFVYREEAFGPEKGLYHAVLDGRKLRPERIADHEMPTELHQDRNSSTAIAVDGAGVVHILAYARPHTGSGIRYHRLEDGAWRAEDPARDLAVRDDERGTATLAAGDGRVVAAIQLTGERVAVVERTSEGWRAMHILDAARAPRVALSADGDVHLAWLRPTRDGWPDRGVDGDLLYARASDGWREVRIAREVMEQTRFWPMSEPDGTFDLALAPDGRAHLVWETARDGRGYTVLRDGQVEREERTPLTPDHGNPQLRMRLVVDAQGRSHAATGYGSLDLYGLRGANGGWSVDTSVDRLSMLDVAALPDGRAVIVGTQGHGGTTLALLMQSRAEEEPLPTADALRLPVSAPGGVLLGLVAALVAQGFQRRRG